MRDEKERTVSQETQHQDSDVWALTLYQVSNPFQLWFSNRNKREMIKAENQCYMKHKLPLHSNGQLQIIQYE